MTGRDIDMVMHGVGRELAEALAVMGREPDLAENRWSAFLSHVRVRLEETAEAAFKAGYLRGEAAASTDAHVLDEVLWAYTASHGDVPGKALDAGAE